MGIKVIEWGALEATKLSLIVRTGTGFGKLIQYIRKVKSSSCEFGQATIMLDLEEFKFGEPNRIQK